MKSLYKLVLASSLTAVGLFGLQGSAMALVSINANICQIDDPSPGIVRNGGFIGNVSARSRVVICPVMRIGPAPAAGWSVYVDGTAPARTTAGGALRCQLESYNYENSFLGAVSFTIENAGKFDQLLTLPATQIPFYSHQVLVCSLPPNGYLYDIQPTNP